MMLQLNDEYLRNYNVESLLLLSLSIVVDVVDVVRCC